MAATDTTSTLYTAAIGQVDLRARLFRECEAMVAFASARGRPLDPPVLQKLGLLDVGIAARGDITMSQLAGLHGDLARAVQPALPRSLELMAWDSRVRPWRHRLAPVPALRVLMVLAAIFVVGFCWVFTTGRIDAASVAQDLYTLAEGGRLGSHLLFYFTLAGIGASFQSLYDAYGYVREGTYDPGDDSTYLIRIGLGLIAGLILAQLVPTDPPAAGDGDGLTAAVVAKPLLALLGGFAAQLVHRVLQRLVETVDGFFRPELRRQVALEAREIRAEQRVRDAERVNAAAVEAAPVLARLRTTDDPGERAHLLDRLTAIFMPAGEGARAAAGMTPLADTAARYLARARRWVGTAGVLAELLPEEGRARARAFVDRATSELNRVDDLRRTLAEGDVVAAAKEVADAIHDAPDNPVTERLRGVLDRFAPILDVARAGPLAGAALGPAGLAFGVLVTGAKFGAGAGRAYLRWRARVLDADYDPELMPPSVVNPFGVKAALGLMRDRGDPFGVAFAEMLTAPAELQRFGELALADADPGPFLDAYDDAFAGTRDALAAGLATLRRIMLDRVVAEELPAEVVEATGARSAEELLAAVDAVQSDEVARGDLELLALMAERVRAGTLALEDVEEALDAARDGPARARAVEAAA
ncbi:MAG: hypothetical protein GVY33_07485 [Alphaproteobacteria bacterium]|nr:hypothetical protein [Alphaproteobacteria bacterium]